VKRPTKFFECPVHLCAVPCHGRCDPVGFTVSAATSDRYNMIDRGPNLPEGRGASLPFSSLDDMGIRPEERSTRHAGQAGK
jgi:hypothetical protein